MGNHDGWKGVIRYIHKLVLSCIRFQNACNFFLKQFQATRTPLDSRADLVSLRKEEIRLLCSDKNT